jgi:hypothetical protein
MTENGKYSAQAWQPVTSDLQLSKGVVLVREVDVLSMIMTDGQIPDTLQHYLRGKFIDSEKAAIDTEPAAEETWEQLPALMPFIKTVVRAALVQPKIVDEVQDTQYEITIDLLPLPDQITIFTWAFDQIGELDAVISFRGEQPGSLFSGRDGEAIRETTE